MYNQLKTKTITQLKRLLKNKNFTIFLVFFVISSFIWFLNKLRDDYVVDYRLEYNCTDIPAYYFVDVDSLQLINISIKADGFNLLRLKFSKQPKLSVNISKLPHYRVNNNFGAYLIPNRIGSEIASLLPSGINLEGFNVDTVYIRLLNIKRKFVPVKPKLDITVDKQYTYSSPIVVEPDSVWISGTNNYIDTIEYAPLMPLSRVGLRDSLSVKLAFDLPSKVKLSSQEAKVSINIEPIMERTINVTVTAKNIPSEYSFHSFPISVKVVSKVGFSSYEQVDPEQFDAYVDFDGMTLGSTPAKMKVKVNCKTDKVKSFTYSPLFVEYLLERKR